MVQSLTGKKVVSKSAVVFTGRMCSLVLLLSSVLLLTGCANMSPDDREIFYSGWANPNPNPRTQ